jgi:hypothetical protein
MLMRSFAGSLAMSLAALALSGCGDDGSTSPDAIPPDADPVPDCYCSFEDARNDAGPSYDYTIDSIAGGRIEPLGIYDGIRGAAQLVRSKEVVTAELYVEGLTASTAYIAHVHALPCEENSAGSHYKHDPAITEEREDNEIWLRFTTDAAGAGVAAVQQPGKIARMDAQSIVIHDPASGGAKMACANLRIDDAADAAIEHEGVFTVYDDAPAADESITGTALMTVSPADGETVIQLDVEGLDQAGTYLAHVHALPCSVNKAGGHYKRDTTVAEEQEANEIWPDLTSSDAQMFDHVVRYDAQSIVIHRVEASASPKVACADLVRATEKPEYVTEGTAGALGGGDLEATATLARKKDGSTEIGISVTGLPDASNVPVFVHAGTCDLDPPGGPRYKLDPELSDNVLANQFRLSFDTSAAGSGMASETAAAHLARPEAISVVVSDATDGRVACIELE